MIQGSKINHNIGYLLNIRRNLAGFSLRDISAKTGIGPMQISRYEREISDISPDNLNKLFLALDIKLVDSDEIKKELDEIFHEFERKLFFYQINYNEEVENLKKYEELYLNSSYAHVYVLMMFICMLNLNNPKEEMYFNILEHLDLKKSYIKQFYYAYKARKMYLKNDYVQAEELYREAISVHFDEMMYAFLNYCLAIVLSNTGKYYEALDCTKIAKEIFSKECNFYRMIQAKMCEGNIYMYIGNNTLAYESFKITLTGMKILGFEKDEIEEVEFNIAVLLIELKEYAKALKILDSLYLMNKKNINIISLYVQYYIEFDNTTKAMDWILKGEKLAESVYECDLFKIYRIISLKDTTKQSLNKLIKLYDEIESQLAQCEKNMIIDWIVKVSETRKDYKTANSFLKMKKLS